MNKIAVTFTVQELQGLTTLAETQMFRIKYIDPRFPGHKIDQDEFRAGQSAISIIHGALQNLKGIPEPQLVKKSTEPANANLTVRFKPANRSAKG